MSEKISLDSSDMKYYIRINAFKNGTTEGGNKRKK